MKRGVALILVTIVLAAGCIGAPQDVDSASVAPDSPLLSYLEASRGFESSADEAIVLHTNATPEGRLAAFWWTIPEGVLLQEDDDDDPFVLFLAAPVLLEEERAPLERWTLLGFLAEDGQLNPNQVAFGAPLSFEGSGLLGGGGEEIERSLEPFVFAAYGKLKPGGRVGFVVGGVASEDVELALVLRPFTALPDEDYELPEDTDEFLAEIVDAGRVALPASGSGGMHQLALYATGSNGFGEYAVTSGPVEVEGSMTGANGVGARRQTITAAFPSGGYGLAAAGYNSGGGAGNWAAKADAHGIVAEQDGTQANAFGLPVTGVPFVVAMGEGDAPSETYMGLDVVTAGVQDSLFVFELDLDATLTELFGLPAASIQFNGGAGIGPSLVGDDLVFDVGGVRVVAPGVR